MKPVKPPVSFEIFPPGSPQGWGRLYETIGELDAINPAYFSVTYGAGGGSRERSFRLVSEIGKMSSTPVVAHLTCWGHSRGEIVRIISRYEEAGVRSILALLGDPPRPQADDEQGWSKITPKITPKNEPQKPGGTPEFIYARDLVAFISRENPALGIGVAGFPEGHHGSLNRIKEIDYLKEKVDAGADYIVTQFFFDNRDYMDFVQRCRLAGISVPIVPGIMPVLSRSNMLRMAGLAPRSRFPAEFLRQIRDCRDDEEVAEAGLEWAVAQVRGLVGEAVPGVHIYTLNQSVAGLEIVRSLATLAERL